MVRQPRPESAVCTVQPGLFDACRPVPARQCRTRRALAAIIDDRHARPSLRSSLLHAFPASCPLPFTPLGCLRQGFALVTYCIQNQCTGPFGLGRAVRAAFGPRQAPVAPGP